VRIDAGGLHAVSRARTYWRDPNLSETTPVTTSVAFESMYFGTRDCFIISLEESSDFKKKGIKIDVRLEMRAVAKFLLLGLFVNPMIFKESHECFLDAIKENISDDLDGEELIDAKKDVECIYNSIQILYDRFVGSRSESWVRDEFFRVASKLFDGRTGVLTPTRPDGHGV
jgi:hypothetical protein